MSWDLLSGMRCWGALLWPRRPLQDLFIKLPLPEMTATKPTPWQGITPGDRCNRYAAFHQWVAATSSVRTASSSPTRACLLTDSEVDHGVGQGDAAEERQGVFVVPCGDATPLLEA